MPFYKEHIFAHDGNQSTNSTTEYQTRFMSPRREDYIPPVVLPKIGTARPLTRNRSFLSFDVNPNSMVTSSEYSLRFPNHHPKRPFVCHAQPSQVFDYTPAPTTSRLSARSPTFLKDTEYQERFPNYSTYIPTKELIPPHLSAQPNTQSYTQAKKERMTRSQYFHELINEHEKFYGGKRMIGDSEQRTAFQWPHQYQPKVQPTSYSTMTMYESMPPIYREVFNSSN